MADELPKHHGSINYDLLAKIQAVVLAQPQRVQMAEWINDDNDDCAVASLRKDCGTAGCIGGWACALGSQRPISLEYVPTAAMLLLGLSDAQSARLFYVSGWPADWRNAYLTALEMEPDSIDWEDDSSALLAAENYAGPAERHAAALVIYQRLQVFIDTEGEI